MNINPKPIQTDWTPCQIPGLTSWVVYVERLGGFFDMQKGELLFLGTDGKEYRMPSTIKLLDIVAIPNTRHLWPKEFEGLVKAWEETRNNDQLGIIADWLDDHDEPELAHAFRWCYRRKIEIKKSGSGSPQIYYVEKTNLPHCLQYENSIVAINNGAGMCGVMAHFADIFAEVREAIA